MPEFSLVESVIDTSCICSTLQCLPRDLVPHLTEFREIDYTVIAPDIFPGLKKVCDSLREVRAVHHDLFEHHRSPSGLIDFNWIDVSRNLLWANQQEKDLISSVTDLGVDSIASFFLEDKSSAAKHIRFLKYIEGSQVDEHQHEDSRLVILFQLGGEYTGGKLQFETPSGEWIDIDDSINNLILFKGRVTHQVLRLESGLREACSILAD